MLKVLILSISFLLSNCVIVSHKQTISQTEKSTLIENPKVNCLVIESTTGQKSPQAYIEIQDSYEKAISILNLKKCEGSENTKLVVKINSKTNFSFIPLFGFGFIFAWILPYQNSNWQTRDIRLFLNENEFVKQSASSDDELAHWIALAPFSNKYYFKKIEQQNIDDALSVLLSLEKYVDLSNAYKENPNRNSSAFKP